MHDWPAGEIFRVRDIQAATGKEHLAAIKVEKEETVLKFETNVLRKLQGAFTGVLPTRA